MNDKQRTEQTTVPHVRGPQPSTRCLTLGASVKDIPPVTEELQLSATFTGATLWLACANFSPSVSCEADDKSCKLIRVAISGTQRCNIAIGWSGDAASRSCSDSGRGVLPSSYKKPCTHWPAGVWVARCRSAAWTSAIASLSQATMRICCTPDWQGCAWASMEPWEYRLSAQIDFLAD
jgi:hypothetical protein